MRCPLCGYATDTAGRCTLQGCTNVGLDPVRWVYPASPATCPVTNVVAAACPHCLAAALAVCEVKVAELTQAVTGPGGRVKVPERWLCSQGAWHCECYDEVARLRALLQRHYDYWPEGTGNAYMESLLDETKAALEGR